ncbi:hypothetical protein [uncultured Dokdonia sp.]|uniref:hypothetical protein n=1 Tax=uncultured Dokdonia sp. TaxID=575653 RepID=UPI0026228614|nr:hypothetical protein [uncultured Dokdonia sp.]
MNNFKLKYKDHFKLYIPIENHMIFESELNRLQLPFYSNIDEQPSAGEQIRYFLRDKDRVDIDLLLKNNGIIAVIETINIVDFQKQKKIVLLVILIIVILIISIIISGYIEKIMS